VGSVCKSESIEREEKEETPSSILAYSHSLEKRGEGGGDQFGGGRRGGRNHLSKADTRGRKKRKKYPHTIFLQREGGREKMRGEEERGK